MTSRTTALAAALLLLALVACKSETTDGLPNSDTTGTAQSPSTATSDPTTTGATGGTSSTVSPADKDWVAMAGMAGLAEVQMGNLALQKAENADVKAFAQRMVTDHTKSNEELQQLVSAKGLTLPAQLDGEHKAGMDHLSGLSGKEFDKAYMQHMTADHDKAVEHFTAGSTQAADADIKAFATKSLPVLQEHATLAKTVAGKTK
jgi:putative membrane protein